MANIEYPRLCGGTFMTLVIQALLQRKKAKEHYKGESDKLNDPDVLVGLIEVFDQRVRNHYLAARNDICTFVDSFIETRTKLRKMFA